MPRLIHHKTIKPSSVKGHILSSIGSRSMAIKSKISRTAYREGSKNLEIANNFNVIPSKYYRSNNSNNNNKNKGTHQQQLNAQPKI